MRQNQKAWRIAGKVWHSKWFSHKLITNASASIHKLALSAAQHTHTYPNRHTHVHIGSNKNCQIAETLSPINRTNRSPNFAAFRLLSLTFLVAYFCARCGNSDTCSAAAPAGDARSATSTTTRSACTATPRWPAPPRSAISRGTRATRAQCAGEWDAITSFIWATLHTSPSPLHHFQLSPARDNNHNASQWQRPQWRRTHAHHGRLAQRECQLWVRASWGLRPAQGSTTDPAAAHAGVALELKRGQLDWRNGDYRKSSCRSATLSFK